MRTIRQAAISAARDGDGHDGNGNSLNKMKKRDDDLSFL